MDFRNRRADDADELPRADDEARVGDAGERPVGRGVDAGGAFEADDGEVAWRVYGGIGGGAGVDHSASLTVGLVSNTLFDYS